MTIGLQDHARAPWEIIRVVPGDLAYRNDGATLKLASRNPWFQLVSICREIADGDTEIEQAKAAARTWNAIMLQYMPDGGIEQAYEDIGLVREVVPAPVHDALIDAVAQRLLERTGLVLSDLMESGPPDFSETCFPDRFDARFFHFPRGTLFRKAQFADVAQFDGACFLGEADFSGAVSHANFYLRFGFVGPGADFQAVRFQTTATFRKTTIVCPVDFFHAEFGAWSYFEETVFTALASRGVKADPSRTSPGASFRDCVFKGPASFRRTRFARNYPDFDGAVLPEAVEFTANDDLWPNPGKAVSNAESEAAERTCKILSHAMARRGQIGEAHFFFRHEMWCKAHQSDGIDALFLRLYGLGSNFGFSVLRPIAGLGALWALGWLYFFFRQAPACYRGLAVGPADCNSKTWLAMADAAGISFSNIFAFLGFSRLYMQDLFEDASRWTLAVASAQTVLGVILLFFLGLGLRNRFRLK